MKGLLKLTSMQFKLYMREPIALFFALAFPMLLLVLFGVIYGNEAGGFIPELTEYGYIDLQVPALVSLVLGTVGFMTIPVATASAREQRILRRYKATPMNPATYIIADVVVNFFVALIGVALLILVAKLLFGLRFGGNWALVGIGFALSTLCFIAMGYVIASIAPNSKVAQTVGMAIFFPLMFLSGAAMPLFIMPEIVQKIAQYNPMTQVVNLLQELWHGGSWNVTSSLAIGALLIIGFLVSVRFFRWE